MRWFNAVFLSLLLFGCGGAGDEACSTVSVVGSNSQATCNGNNVNQGSGSNISADEAASICCTQEKVDELRDDDCLREVGYGDSNLCRAGGGDSSGGSNSDGSTTLDFN